ncbi:hypothetical protein RYH80_18405 [Halobaculum sp. MBLA0147]|uniref:DUF7545 family protein n=1 Tax=Halobaculum sp. MBLA0147 TaxID=3079934 RepID=UPI00352426FE
MTELDTVDFRIEAPDNTETTVTVPEDTIPKFTDVGETQAEYAGRELFLALAATAGQMRDELGDDIRPGEEAAVEKFEELLSEQEDTSIDDLLSAE